MDDRSHESKEPALWCAGLPFVSRERLGKEDEAHLVALSLALRRRVALAMLSVPLVPALLTTLFLTPIYACGRWPECSLPADAESLLVFAGVVGPVIGFAACILWFRDVSEPDVELRRDLLEAEILVFQGDVSSWWAADDVTFDALARRGLMKTEGPQRIEVLSRSRRVFRVNGARIEAALRAMIIEAPLVPAMSISAVRTRARPLSGFPHPIQSADRPLTAEEAKEIDELIWNSHGREVLPFLVVCGFFGFSGSGALGMILEEGRPFGLIWLAGCVAIIAYRAVVLRRGKRDAQEFELDKASGKVIHARFPMMNGRVPGLTPPIEFLPHSGWIWTYDSQPAPWRTRIADVTSSTRE